MNRLKQQRNKYWRFLVECLSFLAEASNIGIVVEVIAGWLPGIASIFASGPLAYLTLIADPLIYCFRALIRLTRITGRTFFDVQFEEEKNGSHPLQTMGDVLSLCCFSLAVTFFCGVLAAPPVGITLAWTMGLCGLGIVSFFDYIWPEKLTREKYQDLKNSDASETIKTAAYSNYIYQRNSKRLFLSLLVGLSLLLICGSAAAFAPPLLVPILYYTSKAASIFLGGIACARLYNWCVSGKKDEIDCCERKPLLSGPVSSSNQPEMSPRGPQLNLVTRPSVLLPSSSLLEVSSEPQTVLESSSPDRLTPTANALFSPQNRVTGIAVPSVQKCFFARNTNKVLSPSRDIDREHLTKGLA